MACHLATPGGLTCPCRVAAPGWRRARIVGTASSWPAVLPHARVACESHDGPDDPQASWAPKAPEQGRHGSDVLACPGEVWKGFIIIDDPPVHVMDHGARTPTVSVALDLSLKPRAFLLELEPRFLELLVLGLQLLYPQAR